MAGKDKLRKFAEIRTFKNVYSSKNFTEPIVINSEEEELDIRGKWNEHFGNDNPIVLELACGKGHYARGLGQRYPNKNFIGIDLKGNRIWKGASEALDNGEENVAFLRARIEFLERYFAAGEVAEIWVTFADPQYKKPKKRLTHARFLGIYKNILKEGGLVHYKSDSTELYEFTLEVLEEEKIPILYKNADIYASELENPDLEIQTYYERMHLALNKTIKYVRFIP